MNIEYTPPSHEQQPSKEHLKALQGEEEDSKTITLIPQGDTSEIVREQILLVEENVRHRRSRADRDMARIAYLSYLSRH